MKWTFPISTKTAENYNNCADIIRNAGNVEYVLFAMRDAIGVPIIKDDEDMAKKLTALKTGDLLYRDEFDWIMGKIDEFIILYNSMRPDKQSIANDIRQNISYVLMNQIEQFLIKLKRNILSLWGM